MNDRIMIIEDNENIRIELMTFFERNGFETIGIDAFGTVESIIRGILEESPKLLLLDINLGEVSGFDLCRGIRKSMDIPILFVTARDNDLDEIQAMALGGDDYIRKPYHLPVLLAKVRRILERSDGSNEELVIGEVHLHIVQGQILYQDATLDLTKNELKILYFLFKQKGEAVSKDELIEYLWTNKFYVDENILNVNLSRLRKRLGEIGLKTLIETVPKYGYRIRA